MPARRQALIAAKTLATDPLRTADANMFVYRLGQLIIAALDQVGDGAAARR